MSVSAQGDNDDKACTTSDASSTILTRIAHRTLPRPADARSLYACPLSLPCPRSLTADCCEGASPEHTHTHTHTQQDRTGQDRALPITTRGTCDAVLFRLGQTHLAFGHRRPPRLPLHPCACTSTRSRQRAASVPCTTLRSPRGGVAMPRARCIDSIAHADRVAPPTRSAATPAAGHQRREDEKTWRQ